MRTLKIPVTDKELARLQFGMRHRNNMFDRIESLAHVAMQAGLCALEEINFDMGRAVRQDARRR